MLPAPPPPPPSPPLALRKDAAVPPPTRSAAAAVSGTPPKAKDQPSNYFTGSQTKTVRQGVNKTYTANAWKPIEKCTCSSAWCKQLNNSPIEVAGLRAKLTTAYTAMNDDYAKRLGGKQYADKYLARMIKGIAPKTSKLIPNDADGHCGYCHEADHSFKHCPFRSQVEAEDKARPPTKFEYFVDNVDETKSVLRPVCAVTYSSVYDIGRYRLATIKKHFVTGPLSNDHIFRQAYTARDDTATKLHDKRLLDILKSKELGRSHYSASTSKAATLYFLSGELTQKMLYDEYLGLYDVDFKAQCLRMNHMSGYHNKKDEPSVAQYEQDEKKCKLTPSISYWYVRHFLSRHDIKFEALKTDTCSECARLQYLISTGGEESEYAQEEQRVHIRDADTCYAEKRKDKERAKAVGSNDVTIEIDLATGLRTPYTTVGAAYFQSMMNTSVYIVVVHSTGGNTRELLYFFNETIEGKGADMVASILAHVVEHYLQPKVGERPIDRLVAWCDGTAGQVWNNPMLGFVAELVESKSPFFCARRLDVRRGPVGHTFLTCDTVGGRIAHAGLKYLQASKGSGIHATFPIPSGLVSNFMSWQEIIEDLIATTFPKMTLIPMKLADFKDVWKYTNESSVFVTPTKKSCENSPDWMISDTREWNFGWGERSAGAPTYAHPGVVYTRKNPLQHVPHRVKIAPKAVDVSRSAALVTADLDALRASKVNLFEVKRTVPIPMTYAKRKALHHVVTIMVATPENATLCGYPDPGPDPDSAAQKKKQKADKNIPGVEMGEGGGEEGGGGGEEGGNLSFV